MDDTAKEPAKVLVGHTKAVRELAYSERHKILCLESILGKIHY
jgi:hypothetical protein